MKLVLINDAEIGMVLAQDIVEDGAEVPLAYKGTSLDRQLIKCIEEHGVKLMYIQDSSDDEEPTVDTTPAGSDISLEIPEVKPTVSAQLRDEAVQSLGEVFSAMSVNSQELHEASKIIKQMDQVVEQLVGSITDDASALVNINDLKSYDEYTYHHSLSVAVLSIAVAQYLGLGKADLAKIAKTAMMHDIGKTSIPIEIIQKTSKLDDSEFAIIKTHSRAGYDFLAGSLEVDDEIRNAVLFHHEKFDGSGYPFGLKGNDIPLWSRIISVADVYDALTSNRPYRQPVSPSDALEYIMGGAGSAFDFDIVEALGKKLEPYPVGSLIELSNGHTAVVLDTKYAMRPVIKLVQSGEIWDLYNDTKYLNVVVNRLIRDIPPIPPA